MQNNLSINHAIRNIVSADGNTESDLVAFIAFFHDTEGLFNVTDGFNSIRGRIPGKNDGANGSQPSGEFFHGQRIVIQAGTQNSLHIARRQKVSRFELKEGSMTPQDFRAALWRHIDG